MMPGTVLERATAHVTTAVLPAVQVNVTDLTAGERAVALYASDMPNTRRRPTLEQRRAWIVQGVERLGCEEVSRRAVFSRAHKLLSMHGLESEEIQRRHDERFPKPRRLIHAEQEAANSVYRDGISPAATARNPVAVVDGECPCGSTGSIPVFYDEDCGPVNMMCPVHERAAIHAHRWGLSV
ncbi:hypothetical protein OG705_25640 [Streptomyces sp. NBC_00838]|uniref:hypothetical protein n=1 Tax=Streptomyces sp. NBC_00838 TaxID=2903680 RepID=UPI00386AE984|nr:hypothetical protein OG705_25640 [Streptomyces sp. NBC_00838]